MPLQNLTQLNLNLSANNIEKEGAANIAEALATLKNITQLNLNLEENNIEIEGAASITQALATL
jgi:hypothetical protein